MNQLYVSAKEQANKFGFTVTEKEERDIDTGKMVLVVKVDRIGPPCMMQHYKPSPFNDRFSCGAWWFFIEWVAKLNTKAQYQ